MSEEVRLPKLGVSVTECTLVAWLVDDGAEVSPGTELYEVATDKTETVIEAPSGGQLRILVKASEDVLPVGTLVAEIA